MVQVLRPRLVCVYSGLVDKRAERIVEVHDVQATLGVEKCEHNVKLGV